jgi:hypothetical protein
MRKTEKEEKIIIGVRGDENSPQATQSNPLEHLYHRQAQDASGFFRFPVWLDPSIDNLL